MEQKRQKFNPANALLILIAIVLGALVGVMAASHYYTKKDYASLDEKIGEVLNLVSRNYVDVIDVDSVGDRMLSAILSELDPHSTYLSARQTERTEEILRGNFEGVGLVLYRENDTTFIRQVLADGPSAGSGLLPGDLIWAVDDVPVSGIPADSVVSRLRGSRNSKVKITVKRLLPTSSHQPSTHEFTIRRNIVPHHSLTYYGMLDDTTGIIILNTFASTSHNEFYHALRQLKQQGMRKLIFDLRGNTGGSLESAVGIANELLPAGSLIVYTQGAHQKREDIFARAGGLFTSGPLIVLVDESSASASEVVSGALQDNDRAVIAGRRTFGKGLVQREFSLKDGSSVLLTVARYYTPSGRSIQRPYEQGIDSYYQDYMDQLLYESYADNPSPYIADSTPYYTVGGRTVYGGGGIIPDLLLPYLKDTSYVYINQLSSAGILVSTAFRLVRLHAGEWLKRYPDATTFRRHFSISDDMLLMLVSTGEKKNIPFNAEAFSAQKQMLSSLLKAHIGDFLFGSDAFYPISLQIDEDIKRIK